MCLLLQTASPDAFVRLENTPLADQQADLLKLYNDVQHHTSLEDFLQHHLRQSGLLGGLLLQVYHMTFTYKSHHLQWSYFTFAVSSSLKCMYLYSRSPPIATCYQEKRWNSLGMFWAMGTTSHRSYCKSLILSWISSIKSGLYTIYSSLCIIYRIGLPLSYTL